MCGLLQNPIGGISEAPVSTVGISRFDLQSFLILFIVEKHLSAKALENGNSLIKFITLGNQWITVSIKCMNFHPNFSGRLCLEIKNTSCHCFISPSVPSAPRFKIGPKLF